MIYRMAIRILDELKTLKSDIDNSFVRKTIMDFFDEMDVEYVEQRTQMAISLERIVQDVLLLALVGEVTREELIEQLIEEYSQAILANGYKPNYAHIERVAETLVDNTLEDIDNPYMTSTDRFIVIACTEANNAANYSEYKDALEEGMTEKVWHTMRDNKVRKTHEMIDGMIIGITDLFIVGDAEMRFPCDEELAFNYPEETVNCRCTVTYQ